MEKWLNFKFPHFRHSRYWISREQCVCKEREGERRRRTVVGNGRTMFSWTNGEGWWGSECAGEICLLRFLLLCPRVLYHVLPRVLNADFMRESVEHGSIRSLLSQLSPWPHTCSAYLLPLSCPVSGVFMRLRLDPCYHQHQCECSEERLWLAGSTSSMWRA